MESWGPRVNASFRLRKVNGQERELQERIAGRRLSWLERVLSMDTSSYYNTKALMHFKCFEVKHIL